MTYLVRLMLYKKQIWFVQKLANTLLKRTCKHVWNRMQHKSARTGMDTKEPAGGKGDRRGGKGGDVTSPVVCL